jgi:hypothetical protein
MSGGDTGEGGGAVSAGSAPDGGWESSFRVGGTVPFAVIEDRMISKSCGASFFFMSGFPWR